MSDEHINATMKQITVSLIEFDRREGRRRIKLLLDEREKSLPADVPLHKRVKALIEQHTVQRRLERAQTAGTAGRGCAAQRDQPGRPDRAVAPRKARSGSRLKVTRQKSQRVAELQKLRAELVKQLDRLDFRSESIGPALAKMARHTERTVRRLLT